MWTPPEKPRSRSQGRPAPMCSFKEWGRYCVRIMTSKTPELTQLESVKSMIRYLPAKGTAGLARLSVNTPRREPSPPARMTARVLIVVASGGVPVQRAGALVERHILRGRAAPGEIGPHAPPLNFGPLPRLSVHRERAVESIPKRPGGEFGEQKAIPIRVAGVTDCVGQAAGAPGHRDGAVAHSDHLGQAAGLIARRNQDHVRAGVDLSREERIEPQAGGSAAWMVPLDCRELGFERRLARAQQHELPAGRQPAPDRWDRYIEALLLVQA